MGIEDDFNMRRPFAFLITLLLLAGRCPRAAVAEDRSYEVNFDRPSRVGVKGKIETTIVRETEWKWTNDQSTTQPVPQVYGVSLSGDDEILEVQHGSATAVTITLTKPLCESKGSADSILLPAGTKVLAVASGEQTKYSVNGKPVTEEAAAALHVAYPVTSNEPADVFAQIYGGVGRKKIGDTWPGNYRALAEACRRQLGMVSEKDIHGDAKLVEESQVGDERCLKLDLGYFATHYTPPPFANQPAGYAVDGGSFEAHFLLSLPIDPSSATHEGDCTTVARLHGMFDQKGAKIPFDLTIRTEMTSKFIENKTTN
jgi:hypothetical protein